MNLVPNGSFESFTPPNNFTNWTNTGDYVADSTIPRSGLHAPQIGFNNGKDKPAQGGIMQTFSFTPPVTPPTTYYFSFWMAIVAGTSDPIVFTLVALPSNTVYGGGTQTVPYVGQAYNTYYQYKYTFSGVPTNTTGFLIAFSTASLGEAAVIDDVYLGSTAICYLGDSMVRTRKISSGEIMDIPAREVYTGDHEVFDVIDREYTPVVANIISGPVKSLFCIHHDSIDGGIPDRDLYITGGHRILINGIETKVRDMPQAVRTSIEPDILYSICTDRHRIISVNNTPVVAWGLDEWLAYSERMQIVWHDNSKN